MSNPKEHSTRENNKQENTHICKSLKSESHHSHPVLVYRAIHLYVHTYVLVVVIWVPYRLVEGAGTLLLLLLFLSQWRHWLPLWQFKLLPLHLFNYFNGAMRSTFSSTFHFLLYLNQNVVYFASSHPGNLLHHRSSSPWHPLCIPRTDFQAGLISTVQL